MNVYQKLLDKTDFLHLLSRCLENRMNDENRVLFSDGDRDLYIKTLESTAQEVFALLKQIKDEEVRTVK